MKKDKVLYAKNMFIVYEKINFMQIKKKQYEAKWLSTVEPVNYESAKLVLI